MSGLLPLAVGIGLVYGLLASELFGLASVGLVVPGYLALLVGRPLWLLALLMLSVLVFGLLKLTSRYTLLFGRRRMALALLLGYALSVALSYALVPGDAELHVIGFLVPGLIALWMDRQGLLETLAGLCILTALVRLSLLLVYGAELWS